MSLNLQFRVIDDSATVDFPFQTPTELSEAVMKTKDKEIQIKLIVKYLKSIKWNEPAIRDAMVKIRSMLYSKHLKLEII